MKNMKGKTGKVLTQEDEILEMWKEYFKELTNTGEMGRNEDYICINNQEEGRGEERIEITKEKMESAV